MSDEWIFVGYPIDSLDETHIYIQQNDLFVQRCDTDVGVTNDDVVQVTDDEVRQMLDDDSKSLCSECVRHLSGLAMA